MKTAYSFLIAILCAFGTLSAQQADYLTPQPLSKVIGSKLSPVKTSSTTLVPLITWGGDIATIYGKQEGIFQKNGLNVKFFKEDDFRKQVQRCLSGETPYIRGTMGMINAAADAFRNSGTDLVVLVQLTYSTGGDGIAVRKGKNLDNMKTIVVQLYGPHMDYIANLLASKGRLDKVDIKYLRQLMPSDKVGGKAVDPVTVFMDNDKIDAVTAIIPDLLLLTKNGTVGDGGDLSVKGATILTTTKTNRKIIADVYAVRKDYFDANKSKVLAFTKAVMQSEEALRDLLKSKGAKYQKLINESAEILMGSSALTADTEAMLLDCEFVGYNGNVSFFTGKGTTRNFATLKSEIQSSFKKMNIMSGAAPLHHANWDYNTLKSGLKYATAAVAATPLFDKKKTQAAIESKIEAEATSWTTDGTLFVVEINFAANQSSFSASDYAAKFDQALGIAETNSGALITIEGHSDPLAILQAELNLKNGKPNLSQAEINQKKQKAKSLSQQRADAVKTTFFTYCKNKGITLDDSQFYPIGMGIRTPKYNPPTTEAEWNANRRVVFRVKQVEGEAETFTPLK